MVWDWCFTHIGWLRNRSAILDQLKHPFKNRSRQAQLKWSEKQTIKPGKIIAWKQKMIPTLIQTNVVITVTFVASYDNLRCHQWRQSWYSDNSGFSASFPGLIEFFPVFLPLRLSVSSVCLSVIISCTLPDFQAATAAEQPWFDPIDQEPFRGSRETTTCLH